jgi:NADP-dependent 3-hydroxy acid dehydrogenase YdfG
MSEFQEKEDFQKKEEFQKIIYDFVNDILYTFPEYKDCLDQDLKNIIEIKSSESTKNVYEYVKKVYPERFFDLLYKNEDIFTNDTYNTNFLPGIEFKNIWKCDDISDNTRNTIWKYLQLILFTIVGDISSQESFGDTAKLFEAINEEDFKNKIQDSINQMQEMFENNDLNNDGSSGPTNLPNPDELHSHINGLLQGKLGTLATEIAEETAKEMDLDMNDASSVDDVFKKLFKNPGKMMNLVKNVGTKLDSKIKSGDIKESELMQEASELMNKMKDMPGMGNIQSMLKSMGMPNIPNLNGAKVNMGAMRSRMEKEMNKAKRKEATLEKSRQKKLQQEAEKKKQFKEMKERMQKHNQEKQNKMIEELLAEEDKDKEAENKIKKKKKKKSVNKNKKEEPLENNK